MTKFWFVFWASIFFGFLTLASAWFVGYNTGFKQGADKGMELAGQLAQEFK